MQRRFVNDQDIEEHREQLPLIVSLVVVLWLCGALEHFEAYH